MADIASKTLIKGSFPNFHYHKVLVQDFLGNTVEMTSRPLVTGGQPKRDPDSQIGFHFDEFPERVAMQRWFESDFGEIERQAARGWLAALNNLDPTSTM